MSRYLFTLGLPVRLPGLKALNVAQYQGRLRRKGLTHKLKFKTMNVKRIKTVYNKVIIYNTLEGGKVKKMEANPTKRLSELMEVFLLAVESERQALEEVPELSPLPASAVKWRKASEAWHRAFELGFVMLTIELLALQCERFGK